MQRYTIIFKKQNLKPLKSVKILFSSFLYYIMYLINHHRGHLFALCWIFYAYLINYTTCIILSDSEAYFNMKRQLLEKGFALTLFGIPPNLIVQECLLLKVCSSKLLLIGQSCPDNLNTFFFSSHQTLVRQ